MTLDGNAVRSVDRAAALLLALGESHGEAGVTELARRLGLHKSTASRLLATLEKRGLVEQDEESGKYRLGLVVIRLAEPRGADARPALDRDARARQARARHARDHRPGRARRRPAAHRGAGRRPEPRGDGGLDGPLGPAPLRRGRQGPPRGPPGARDPAPRAARPRPVHRAHDHAARAAPRGAGPGPAARVRDRVRGVRAARSTRSRRRSTTRAARSSPPSTCGARRSGSRRAACRSWPSRSRRPRARSPSDSGEPPPERRGHPAAWGSTTLGRMNLTAAAVRAQIVDWLRDPIAPDPADRRHHARPAPPRAHLRPRDRQGAARPRDDRGHGPGAVRGRDQEADGHARAAGRQRHPPVRDRHRRAS